MGIIAGFMVQGHENKEYGDEKINYENELRSYGYQSVVDFMSCHGTALMSCR